MGILKDILKNRIKAPISLLIIFSICFCGVSCSVFGVDNTDYSLESAVDTLQVQSDTAQSLCELCRILTFSQNGIVCFEKFQKQYPLYSNIVLDYLAGTYFDQYSADDKMFSRLAEEYPELSINTLIPAEDLSAAVYTFFGGEVHVKHKSTSRYSYLDKINAYILTGKLSHTYVDIEMLSLYETENTYKATVRFTENDEKSSKDYLVIFKKRNDNASPYIYSVQEAGNI